MKIISADERPAEKRGAIKKQQTKKRYTPKPVPANSFVLSDSPLNTTTRARVRRWHSYHGIPTLFLVVDENGRELCSRFAYEPDALAHCEALEEGLAADAKLAAAAASNQEPDPTDEH
jgi:hypothetical protein